MAVNVVNTMGSKFESPDKLVQTHLFEHLMFGGDESDTIFDIPLQNAGGDNNASTNTGFDKLLRYFTGHQHRTALWLNG